MSKILLDSNQLDPNEYIPDAFYKDGAIWVFRTCTDSICEWMFTHELIHYLREITNNVEPEKLVYHGMILDEVMTDIICSSLKPKLSVGESGYKQYYDVGYQYLNVWKVVLQNKLQSKIF